MNWLNNFSEQLKNNTNFVIVTLIDYKGSVPQALGAKALVTAEGLIAGTIGGGKVEAKAILQAQALLKNDESLVCQMITWNLTLDVGMTCGGVVTFLFEIYKQKAWQIVVYGAGHVAQELVPLLIKLNCHVTCIDERKEWLDKITPSTNLTKILSNDLKATVTDFSKKCFFVLMTQGHSTDLPILSEILNAYDAAYIGVIGSKTKSVSLKSHLKQMGHNENKINSFYSPIGLDIGNNTPIEIAYSIVAQLIQKRDAFN